EIERAQAFEAADPINPQRVFYELSDRLPDGAILTGDAGTATNWYARHVMMRRGMMGSLSGGLATMGSAVPYAIAAKFAHPERTVVACTGDGAMQMNGINELLTVSKYWRTWSNPRLVFLVLHNDDLNQVTWEMRILSGDPKYDASQKLPEFSYAAFAESIGLRGIRVDTPERVGPSWDEALRADRPVVYDAVVAGDVATLPPHITFDQATKFARAMLKGDPERSNVIEESLKGILDAVLPRSR
ncbi:MAG: thiamine pyrophosphate-requiring protein, partial [Candidatus Eremiobacteraeota bacterium]|nr:thiamine pyrophosphate-requiring protein [Candidatus Eremiobacteraeota bacterium]